MGIKDQLTSEQWKALFNGANVASIFVAMASGGGLEMIKEVFTAVKFTQELYGKSGGSGYGVLVDDLLASMKGMNMNDVQENTIKLESGDPEDMLSEFKKIVVDAAAVASTLPGGNGYKRWLLDIARQVAETKTGGVLGIGGKAVIDEKEQAALDELAVLLQV
jgi:hypothetical protein